jgi:alkanesulfonate monooxygenase SsuD/methylene tetrahydromethanopterin reductase-like flavin-dependent oxidoreductase (luciferase family)
MQYGLPHANEHLKGLADSAKEWLTGASTKDYPGYDKLIEHVSKDTAERQMRDGSAFIGTPADIVEMIASYNDQVGGIDSVSLHFAPGNTPLQAAERSLRLFASAVLPKVKAL